MKPFFDGDISYKCIGLYRYIRGKIEELIIKARSGDVKVYTQVIVEVKNNLYKIAKTRMINKEGIEDAI